MMNKFATDLNLKFDFILSNKNFFNELPIDPKLGYHTSIKLLDIDMDFIEWVKSLGLFIKYCELFYTPAHGKIFIHSDEIDPIDSCKINFVYDNGNTLMHWYDIKNNKELKRRNNTIGGLYFSCDDEDDYTLAYEHVVKKGTLVNVSIPHGITNNSAYPRYCVSVIFQKEKDTKRIGYTEMYKLLTPYLNST